MRGEPAEFSLCQDAAVSAAMLRLSLGLDMEEFVMQI